jgi:hypothetical protein
MKIVDYDIISGGRESVAETVKEKIKEGWQPHGSLTFSVSSAIYVQPIVMYDDMPTDVKVIGTVETAKE